MFGEMFDDEATEELSFMTQIIHKQNKLSFTELPPSFKMRKIDPASDRALGNVVEVNPAIAEERGLFVEIFDKATTKGSDNGIRDNQRNLQTAMGNKGKIETTIEMTKMAMDADLRSLSQFCTRLTAAGCTADLGKTGKTINFKIETIIYFIFQVNFLRRSSTSKSKTLR